MRAFTCLIVLISIFGSTSGFSQRYTQETIVAQPLTKSFKKIGRLDFKRTSNLSFKTPGYLQELTVDEGDYFNEKQVLAALETDELKADKNAKYAQLVNAKRNVKRVKQLIERSLGSEQQLNDAETAVDVARAAYRVAFYNLERAQLIAPFSGVVIRRNAELKEMQSPGVPVLEVAALQNNWIVRVALTGEEIQHIRRGQVVSVMINGIGSVEAFVSKVPAKANMQSNLFDVEVTLRNISTNARLISGQIAQVKFDFSIDKLVFRVPVGSLMSVDEAGKAIFLVEEVSNEFTPEAFDVVQIDNQFVYVSAYHHQSSLRVISQGWQHFVQE
jgi:membrane fusion protein, multidrug efflux system